MIASSSIVVVSGDQVSKDLDGETVILHLGTGTYFGLSGVGTRIWNLIQQPVTVNEIRTILCEEFDVARERCEADLIALLGELAKRALIEVKGSQA